MQAAGRHPKEGTNDGRRQGSPSRAASRREGMLRAHHACGLGAKRCGKGNCAVHLQKHGRECILTCLSLVTKNLLVLLSDLSMISSTAECIVCFAGSFKCMPRRLDRFPIQSKTSVYVALALVMTFQALMLLSADLTLNVEASIVSTPLARQPNSSL